MKVDEYKAKMEIFFDALGQMFTEEDWVTFMMLVTDAAVKRREETI